MLHKIIRPVLGNRLQILVRSVSQEKNAAPAFEYHRAGFQNRMSGWEIHEYGDFPEVLQLHKNLRKPKIEDPRELIVKVTASSVNPLDLAMTAGYGASVLNLLRGTDEELPLRLGRDFCGEILYKGVAVDRRYTRGEKVWGVIPPHRLGCHAELVKVHQDHITLKPTSFSDEEAGVVPYAGLTAWSGLFLTGNLKGCGNSSSAEGKKVLILGGSGGVGTMAVQMCRAEKCHVIVTGASDAEELLKGLGADQFIDYKGADYEQQLIDLGELDLILDCAGRGTDYAGVHGWQFKSYVTFSSPLLRNVDSNGLIGGGLKSVSEMARANYKWIPSEGRVGSGQGQGLVKWAYFVAHPQGLKYLRELTEKGQLKPVICHRVSFGELPKAFELLEQGHLRGKIAIGGF